jgi:hypothetical protein
MIYTNTYLATSLNLMWNPLNSGPTKKNTANGGCGNSAVDKNDGSNLNANAIFELLKKFVFGEG